LGDHKDRPYTGGRMQLKTAIKTATGLSELWDGKRISRVRSGDGAALLYGRRLSTHLMAQPQVAQRLLSNSLMIDQGYLSRCLTAWPVSTAGTRKYREVNLRTDTVMRQYEERIGEILKTPLPLADGKRNELAPRPLGLTEEAKRLWVRFHDSIEEQLADNAPLAPIRGFANKAAEHALRLAGVLTLYRDINAQEISAEDIADGITLVQHYLSEALRLFHASMSDPDLELAEKLLTWAQQRGSHIALVEIYQALPLGQEDNPDAWAAWAPFLGWLREYHHHHFHAVCEAEEALRQLEQRGITEGLPYERACTELARRFEEARQLKFKETVKIWMQ
jgi:putative DNA primase/helicase